MFEFDFSEFEAFADNFQKQLKNEALLMDVFNKLGNVALRDLKANTPTGQYDGTVFFVGNLKAGGKKIFAFEPDAPRVRQGGELKRNWKFDGVTKSGDGWVIALSNNTEYASWVEKGHRKADHSGWVEGQFFMELTMEDVIGQVPTIVGPGWKEYLRSFGFD